MKNSRVYREHQSTGLMLARLLGDIKHKVLYIRLAKQYPVSFLMSLASDIASRDGVKNRGAYFMKVLQQSGKKPKLLRQTRQLHLKLRRKKLMTNN